MSAQSIFAASPMASFTECRPIPGAAAIERPHLWNPYSERCETIETMIERGRAERSRTIARLVRRWLRRA